jgi:hypothetical protein
MNAHRFSIIATGPDPDAEGFEDLFFEAGCDDATISVQRGVIVLDFTREGHGFLRCLASAIRNVKAAGATPLRVEPDPLAGISDIAARAGMTRAAISLYALGKRGEGFPSPVARVTSDSPLWNWHEVARWLGRRGLVRRQDVVRSRLLAAVNDRLERARNETNLMPRAA